MSNDTESKGVKRRDFLKVLGTAGATVTTVGCSTDKVDRKSTRLNSSHSS